jgi:hypothetical protein
MEIAPKVRNIAAKHEGGIPDTEKTWEHPSDILNYFMPKVDVLKSGIMGGMEQNYLDKQIPIIAASSLAFNDAWVR